MGFQLQVACHLLSVPLQRQKSSHIAQASSSASPACCLISIAGLGESYSSQFADSISAGDTSSNVGVIAGTLAGAAKATVGSVSVSSKKSADSQSISTSKSGM